VQALRQHACAALLGAGTRLGPADTPPPGAPHWVIAVSCLPQGGAGFTPPTHVLLTSGQNDASEVLFVLEH